MTSISRPKAHVTLFVIAKMTYLIALRGHLLAVSGVAGLLLFVTGLLGAQLNQTMLTRLLIDMGLASGSLVGSIIAATLAFRSYADELSGRYAEPLLVRPIKRGTLLLGKAMGIVLVAETFVVLVAGMTAGLIVATHGTLGPAFWPAQALVAMEVLVVTSLSLLVATQCQTALAASVTGAMWLAGNMSEDLRLVGQKSASPFVRQFALWVFHVLPDLGRLSLRASAANSLAAPAGYLAAALSYGGLYTATCLTLATWLYSRPRGL